MKSTEVQTLGAYPVSCAFIGDASRCSRSPVSCGCYADSIITFCLLVNSSSSPYPLPLPSPKPRATLLQWRLQRRRRRATSVYAYFRGKAELSIRLSRLKRTEEKSRREQQSAVRDYKNVPRGTRTVYKHALHFTRHGDMRTRVGTLIAGLGHGHGLWWLPYLAIQCVCLSKIGHIIIRVVVALKTSVPFTCRFVACSSRIKVDRQTERGTEIQYRFQVTQTAIFLYLFVPFPYVSYISITER